MIADSVATVGKGERKENRRGGGKEKVLWLSTSKEQPEECLLTPFPRRSSCFYIQFHTTLDTTNHHHPLALFAISSSDGGIAAPARYYHGLIYSYYRCHHYNHHNYPLFSLSSGVSMGPCSSS